MVQIENGSAGRLLGVILAIYRFHQDHFRKERQIYKLVIAAAEENWACVRLFKEFLSMTLSEIIEQGIQSGFLDCFTWITNPVLFKELNPDEVERRAFAQVSLLTRPLR